MAKSSPRKMSKIVALHYVKLVFRSLLFIAALVVYIYNRINNTGYLFGGFENNDFLLGFIWIFFIVEMVLRFFPAKLESMGCQKQFRRNYRPVQTEQKEKVHVQSGWRTFSVAAAWIALNGVIGALHCFGLLDAGIMLLVSLAYSVCDIICILFFCPFQTWFMKNKCCTTCRIYNWDYAMMFTPLIFVDNIYAATLFGAALILLIRWELTFRLHPERFSEKTNCSLSCAQCQEKLCHNKRQLRSFLKSRRFDLTGNTILKRFKADKETSDNWKK